MKTVLFIEHTKTLFEQVEIGHGYNQLDVREYVLASEANERIKVLEDTLKTSLELCREIQSSHKASIGSLYSHYTPQLRVGTVTGQAAIISAALEVKP